MKSIGKILYMIFRLIIFIPVTVLSVIVFLVGVTVGVCVGGVLYGFKKGSEVAKFILTGGYV